MKKQNKMQYTTPVLQIVELHAKAAICFDSRRTIDWTYDQSQFSPDGGATWDRPDYGDLVNF